jgi:hypothetical protein
MGKVAQKWVPKVAGREIPRKVISGRSCSTYCSTALAHQINVDGVPKEHFLC